MNKTLLAMLVPLSALCFSTGAMAQAKEIRVLVANHPYGDLLKANIPEFETRPGSVSMSRASRKGS